MSATTISARERLPPTRKDPLPDVRASSTLASAATFVLEEAQFLKDVRSISSHSSMRGEALVSDDDSPMSEMLAFTAPPPPPHTPPNSRDYKTRAGPRQQHDTQTPDWCAGSPPEENN